MATNCFNSHIGLKGCSSVAPTSGIWVNQLPGLSSELADKIANSEQVTLNGVWTDVKTIAKQTLLNDIVNGLSETINFHQIVYQTKRPRPSRTKETIPAFAEYRGILIEAPESRYSQIRIKSLFVYSASVIDVLATVKTWNVWDGSEIDSQDFTIAPGFNEIPLNLDIDLTFSENSVFIGVDSSILDTIYFLQEIDQFWEFWGGNDCPYSGGYTGYTGQELRIGAAVMAFADEPDYETIHRQSRPAGVWAQVEIICSAEVFLCENMSSFTTAALYLLGWQLLMFKIASPRFNFFTTSREDTTEKLMSSYKEQYESNLKRILASIPTDGSGYCFSCENQNLYAQSGMLP